MDKDLMKLNDDELENVSGGTIIEGNELRAAIGDISMEKGMLKDLLREQYGIEVILSDVMGDRYMDTKTKKPIPHSEVIKRIKRNLK